MNRAQVLVIPAQGDFCITFQTACSGGGDSASPTWEGQFLDSRFRGNDELCKDLRKRESTPPLYRSAMERGPGSEVHPDHPGIPKILMQTKSYPGEVP